MESSSIGILASLQESDKKFNKFKMKTLYRWQWRCLISAGAIATGRAGHAMAVLKGP
jgi:hypothetical protein